MRVMLAPFLGPDAGTATISGFEAPQFSFSRASIYSSEIARAEDDQAGSSWLL